MATNTYTSQQQLSTKEQFAILAVEAIVPKGIVVKLLWERNIPVFHFMVRYTHNGVKKTIGTYTQLDEAMNALAAAKAKDVWDSVDTNWREIVASSLLQLAGYKEEQLPAKDTVLAAVFGGRREATEMLQQEQAKLYEMVGWIPPHELARGKSANYTDEDTGEITTIPANIVNRYLDDMDAKLMKMKYAPSGDDLPQQ